MIHRWMMCFAASLVVVGLLSPTVTWAHEPPPIKALLLTGGCCHDYDNQSTIISQGLSARINIEWTIVQEGGKGRDHHYSMIQDARWADGYDIVVHNECFGAVDDIQYLRRLCEAHTAGTPAVVIHCAMHSYRAVEEDDWREVLGVDSRSHGRHEPIDIKAVNTDHPIFRGLWKHWKTPKGELYQIRRVMPTATVLAQGTAFGETHPCVWVNQAGKARVFGTTIGHHNETMESSQWMDMTARGLLWAVGKLRDDGTPAPGYGRKIAAANDWSRSQLAQAATSEQDSAEVLFDGWSLAGWRGDEAYWSVEDGAIVGRNVEGQAVPTSSYLYTAGTYRDFRLLFEVRQTRSEAHSPMHSAVAVLGERFDDRGNPYGFRGPLLMFCNDWGIWDAYRRNRTVPANHSGTFHPAGVERVGDWNRIEVLVIGNRIRFVANGKLVFDFTDDARMLQPSPIGLQLHANARPQEFAFRGLVLTTSPRDELLTTE